MRNKLIFSLSGAAFSFAASGFAIAADMAVKAPLPAPAPANTWAGWYVGGNAGYGWGTTDEMQNQVTSTFCAPFFAGSGCPAFGSAFGSAVPDSFNAKPKGFIGGGEVGYSLQNGMSVYGWEADFQGADIKGSASGASFAVPAGTVNTVNVAGTGSQKLDWLGTVRGRLGLSLWPSALLYATAGFAYGQVKSSVTFSESVGGPCACGPFQTTAASLSQTRAGWVIGCGTEWMFAPRWSFRTETLFYDLGSANLNTAITQSNSTPIPFFGGTIQTTAHYDGFISRAGLNYYF